MMPDPSWRQGVRVGRDHYVRFETCDYSVHPKAIGFRVEVQADLEWVVVRRATEEVARHRRSLTPHRTITDPVHAKARAVLQQRARERVPRVCELDVEVRDLEVYDAVVGAS
jgi:hypothetical protein